MRASAAGCRGVVVTIRIGMICRRSSVYLTGLTLRTDSNADCLLTHGLTGAKKYHDCKRIYKGLLQLAPPYVCSLLGRIPAILFILIVRAWPANAASLSGGTAPFAVSVRCRPDARRPASSLDQLLDRYVQ